MSHEGSTQATEKPKKKDWSEMTVAETQQAEREMSAEIHREAQEQLTRRINKLAVELPGLLTRLQSTDLEEKPENSLFDRGSRIERDIKAIEEAALKIEEELK